MKKIKQKILVLGLIALILLMIGCTQGGGPSAGAQSGTGKAAGEDTTPASAAELEDLEELPNPSTAADTDYLNSMNTGEMTEGIGNIKPKAPTVGK